jgi:hypothetical protein
MKSVDELAQEWGVKKATVYSSVCNNAEEMIKRGCIPPQKWQITEEGAEFLAIKYLKTGKWKKT